MKRKRHGTDEVIRKLREAEALEAQGQTIGRVCARAAGAAPEDQAAPAGLEH